MLRSVCDEEGDAGSQTEGVESERGDVLHLAIHDGVGESLDADRGADGKLHRSPPTDWRQGGDLLRRSVRDDEIRREAAPGQIEPADDAGVPAPDEVIHEHGRRVGPRRKLQAVGDLAGAVRALHGRGPDADEEMLSGEVARDRQVRPVRRLARSDGAGLGLAAAPRLHRAHSRQGEPLLPRPAMAAHSERHRQTVRFHDEAKEELTGREVGGRRRGTGRIRRKIDAVDRCRNGSWNLAALLRKGHGDLLVPGKLHDAVGPPDERFLRGAQIRRQIRRRYCKGNRFERFAFLLHGDGARRDGHVRIVGNAKARPDPVFPGGRLLRRDAARRRHAQGGRLQHAAAGGIGGQTVRLLVAQDPPGLGVERLAVLGFEQDARIIRGGAGSGRDGQGLRADDRGKHGCEIFFHKLLRLDRDL